MEMLTCIKDWELGESREQHADENQEESFNNLWLDGDNSTLLRVVKVDDVKLDEAAGGAW